MGRRPPFFAAGAVIVASLLGLPPWTTATTARVAVHPIAAIVPLLLLAVLENTARRHAESAQEKLNVIAEALAALMASRALEDDALEEAVTRLREAVGLEERH